MACTVLEEDRSRAHIRIPPKGYTDMTLKHILSRYRHLPGIESVRMDTQTFGDIEAVENKADSKNSSILEGENSLNSYDSLMGTMISSEKIPPLP